MNDEDITRAHEAPYSIISALTILTEFLVPATFGIVFGYFISTLSEYPIYETMGWVFGIASAVAMSATSHRIACRFTGSTHLGCPANSLASRLLLLDESVARLTRKAKR